MGYLLEQRQPDRRPTAYPLGHAYFLSFAHHCRIGQHTVHSLGDAMNNRDRQVLWDQVAIAVVVVVFVVVAVWWLQVNFSATMALFVVAGLFAVGLFVSGNVLGRRDAIQVSKHTMDGVGDILHAAADALTANAKGQNYLIRQEDAIAKHVNRLADQRAGFLVDAQRQNENVWGAGSQPAKQATDSFVEYE